jgi:hypothetical protein
VQKRHRASFKGLGSLSVIFVRRDKDNWYGQFGRSHVTLKFRSAHPGHAHVENQAARLRHMIRIQERFRRRITLGSQSD